MHELSLAALAAVSACLVIWGCVSARLESFDITAPIAFVVFGLVVTHGPWAVAEVNLQNSAIKVVAEVTLALVLFADASRVRPHALRADASVSGRLLGIGLPFTIVLGMLCAVGIIAGSGWWVAAALGAIVAPTDAALGASIFSDDRIPIKVRRVLNVESGLNDGIATPFVNLFLAGAVAAESLHGGGAGKALVELVGGAALGVGISIVGSVMLAWSRKVGWSETGFRSLAVPALALFAYSAAVEAGLNGFVAAFCAGIAFGALVPEEDELIAFAEEAGTLMSLLVWFIFGSVMLVPGFEAASWADVLFAVLVLTVVRMVPVAVSLIGSGLDRLTVGFIGWFGPRGLATVVFGLLAVDTLDSSESHRVLAAVVVTVTLSVFAHGFSASPLARRYGDAMSAVRRRAGESPLVPAAPAAPDTASSHVPRMRVRRLSGRRWAGK